MGCKGPISQNVRPYPEMNLQFQAPWVGKLQSCPPKSSYGHGVNSCRVIRARFSRIECETYAQGNFMDCAGSISQMFDPTLGKPSISSSWVARKTMILPFQSHPMDMSVILTEWFKLRLTELSGVHGCGVGILGTPNPFVGFCRAFGGFLRRFWQYSPLETRVDGPIQKYE